jgi:hypothetical protein
LGRLPILLFAAFCGTAEAASYALDVSVVTRKARTLGDVKLVNDPSFAGEVFQLQLDFDPTAAPDLSSEYDSDCGGETCRVGDAIWTSGVALSHSPLWGELADKNLFDLQNTVLQTSFTASNILSETSGSWTGVGAQVNGYNEFCGQEDVDGWTTCEQIQFGEHVSNTVPSGLNSGDFGIPDGYDFEAVWGTRWDGVAAPNWLGSAPFNPYGGYSGYQKRRYRSDGTSEILADEFIFYQGFVTLHAPEVPLPDTLGLLGVGLFALGLARKRQG